MPSALLAVQMYEVFDWIALARNGVGRHRICQRREVLGRESEIQRAESFVEAIAPAGANQGNDIGALRRHPRDCDLCHRSADRVGNRPQAFDKRQVGVQFRPWKRGLMLRYVPSPARAFDQWPLISPRETIGGDADAELKARRQNLVLDPARDQRVFDLQVADGVDGLRAPDGVGTDFGEADVTHMAGLPATPRLPRPYPVPACTASPCTS
jgi:hypothetical protein